MEFDERSLELPPPGNSASPRDIFEAMHWSGGWHFAARLEVQEAVRDWHEITEGLPPLLGARVRPLGHQIFAARRVLWNRAARFVLADEVGLGKTIETGLVLQALTWTDPELRVLVIAPGSMSRQWLCELYLRFGAQVFTHVDASRLSAGDTAEDLFEGGRVIVSTTALEEFPESQEALLEQAWDMIVVDEAHQIPPDRPLYGFLRRLSLKNERGGFLALSATPSKRETRGLLGLLALVAPRVYDPDSPAVLEERLERQTDIWDKLSYTIRLLSSLRKEGQAPSPDDLVDLADEWQDLAAVDPLVSQLRESLLAGKVEAADQLVAYVQEYHRVDHRIVRTRRKTLEQLGRPVCKRVHELLEYECSQAEQLLANHAEDLPNTDVLDENQIQLKSLFQRLLCTTPELLLGACRARLGAIDLPSPSEVLGVVDALRSDPGPAEEERLLGRLIRETPAWEGEERWLEVCRERSEEWLRESRTSGGCTRFRTCGSWIQQHLQEDPNARFLVFSQDRAVVSSFASHMSGRLGEDAVEAFHHALELEDLSTAATRFQGDTSCRVLVSDELGGEGRNFQIATAVIHLDTPVEIARIEQRIGRLDRVGRNAEREVLSVVVAGPVAVERALQILQTEVFGVHERSLGGLEFALPGMQKKIATAYGRGPGALTEEIAPLRELVVQELEDADEAFQWSLDSSRIQLERDGEFAADVASMGGAVADHQPALKRWLKILGLKLSQDRRGRWNIRWNWETLARPLPGVVDRRESRPEMMLTGTFDPHEAQENESLDYFAPGHYLIDAAIRDAHESKDGRVAIFRRDLGPEYRGRLVMVIRASSCLDSAVWLEHGMPAGLRLRAHRFLWPETFQSIVEIRPGQAQVVHEVDSVARNAARRDFAGRREEPPVDVEELLQIARWEDLAGAVQAGVDWGLDQIRAELLAISAEAADKLMADLRWETAYLEGVRSRGNPTHAAEAEEQLALRTALLNSVRIPALNLDSFALLVG